MKRSLGGLILFVALAGFGRGSARDGTNAVRADEASAWTRLEAPLPINHDDKRGYAFAQGFWESTGPTKQEERIPPEAVKIVCTRYNKACGEIRAIVLDGVLEADSFDYYIESWTAEGVVANGFDEGTCGLGHRLSVDFKTDIVTVTDYPKNGVADKDCQSFRNLHEYRLHGGRVVLRPPAPWGPVSNPIGKR